MAGRSTTLRAAEGAVTMARLCISPDQQAQRQRRRFGQVVDGPFCRPVGEARWPGA